MTIMTATHFRSRYSPKAFDGSTVDDGDLQALFEAARWAPSAYNEQPWRFHLALRTDTAAFSAFLAALNEGNRAWAGTASALVFTAARRERRRDGLTNDYAWYDVGQAVGHLTVAALLRGLYLHQMQGFNPEAARRLMDLPSGFDPVTAMAIGRPAADDPAEPAGRTRIDLAELLVRHHGQAR